MSSTPVQRQKRSREDEATSSEKKTDKGPLGTGALAGKPIPQSIFELEEVKDGTPVQVKDVLGQPYPFLEKHTGSLLLVFNVASKCGLTKSGYEFAVEMHKKYQDQGLHVVAFPCNQFGKQEPGTGEEIQKFASGEYGAKFTIMEKVEVNGAETHPIWQVIRAHSAETYTDSPTGDQGVSAKNKVKWNFEMVLVGRDGKPVRRFAPSKTPAELVEPAIVAALASAEAESNGKSKL